MTSFRLYKNYYIRSAGLFQ